MRRTQSLSDFCESEEISGDSRTPSPEGSDYEDTIVKMMDQKPEAKLYLFLVKELHITGASKIDFSEQIRSVEKLINYELSLIERENQIVLLSLTYDLFMTDVYAAKYEILYKDQIRTLAETLPNSNVMALLFKYYATELAEILSKNILFLPTDTLEHWKLKTQLFCRNINKFIGGFGIFTEATAALYKERIFDVLKIYIYQFYVTSTTFLCNWYSNNRGLLSKSLESLGFKGAKSLTNFYKFNQEIRDNFSFIFNDRNLTNKIAIHKEACEIKLKKVDEDFSTYISSFWSWVPSLGFFN